MLPEAMLLSSDSECGGGTHGSRDRGSRGQRSQKGSPDAAVARQATTSKQKTVQEKLDDLHATSVTAQKELFNRDPSRGSWSDRYTALSELRSLPKDPTVPLADLQRELFKQIRSTAFCQFQRAVCRREDVVVPTNIREAIKRGIPNLPKVSDAPDLFSVEGCTIDPGLLPIDVAVKLKLLPKMKRSREDEVIALSDPKVLVGFKFYWECSRRLGDRSRETTNHCLRVIEAPSPSALMRWQKVFKEVGFQPDPAAIGTLLFLHEKSGSNEKRTAREPVDAKKEANAFFKPLRIQAFTSAYDAARKPHHQKANYDSEYPALIALKERWEDYRTRFHGRWVSDNELSKRVAECSSEEEKAQMRQQAVQENEAVLAVYKPLLTDSITLLKGSKDVWKQDIRDRLKEMQDKLDRSPTGSINPIQVDLQVGANSNRTNERLREVTGKDGRNTEDDRLLQRILQEHTAIFRGIHSAILGNAHILEQPQRLFDLPTIRPYQIPRERTALRSQLALGTTRLKDATVKPFIQLKKALEKVDKDLDSALNSGNRKNAQEALSKMFFITRAFHLHNAVQIVRLGLAEPGMPVQRRVAAAINDLTKNLGVEVEQPQVRRSKEGSLPSGRQQTFSEPTDFEKTSRANTLNVEATKLVAALKNIHALHHDLIATKRPATSAGPTADERKAFIENAKKRLDAFEFLAFASQVHASRY